MRHLERRNGGADRYRVKAKEAVTEYDRMFGGQIYARRKGKMTEGNGISRTFLLNSGLLLLDCRGSIFLAE